MNRQLWKRCMAIPGEFLSEFVHLFNKRKRCKPILSRLVYLLKLTVYFAFPLLVLAAVVMLFAYYPYPGFLSQPGWGGVAVALAAAVAICWLIYRFTSKPNNSFEHHFGQPQYIAEDSCLQIKRCRFCPATINLSEHHLLGEWEYAVPDSCQTQSKCAHCGYLQVRGEQHQFGNWEYISNDRCDQLRICARDGRRDERQGVHLYSDWKYIADGACEQEMICSRCGHRETRIEHILDPSKNNEAYPVTIFSKCNRCGEELEIELPPDPGAMSAEQILEYINTFC